MLKGGIADRAKRGESRVSHVLAIIHLDVAGSSDGPVRVLPPVRFNILCSSKRPSMLTYLIRVLVGAHLRQSKLPASSARLHGNLGHGRVRLVHGVYSKRSSRHC